MSDSDTLNRKIILIIFALAIVYALFSAITQAWVGDDAFISFRYAKNLIEGHGLVFNTGERVEGYTNFLWTIIISAGMLVGLEPVTFSWVISIAAYLFTALLLVYFSFRLKNKYGDEKFMAVPLAALMILLQHDYHIYATSGLETSLTSALVTTGFITLILADSRKKIMLAGYVLVMAVLCRPDSLIFYIMGLPYILILGENRKRDLVYYLIPLIAIYLPYWIARYLYYGYPFPNTYYAKSAYLPYYSQGIAYLSLYLRTYYVLLLLPAAMIPAFGALVPRMIKARCLESSIDRVWLLAILFILPYTFYVVRTGGDFMFARFFIPITPICFIFLETVINAFGRKQVIRLGLAILLLLAVFLRWNQFDIPEKRIEGIVDEPSYYPKWRVEKAKEDGANMKKYLGDLDVVVGFYGSQAMTIYFSELPYAIECHTGLTDTYIAHLPLTKRGRPGHEKIAPYDYLYKKKVNFIAKRIDEISGDKSRLLLLDSTVLQIYTYENRVMEKLKKYPEIWFADFPSSLDNFISGMDSIPDDRFIKTFEFYKSYYFDRNNDPTRLTPLLERVKRIKRIN